MPPRSQQMARFLRSVRRAEKLVRAVTTSPHLPAPERAILTQAADILTRILARMETR